MQNPLVGKYLFPNTSLLAFVQLQRTLQSTVACIDVESGSDIFPESRQHCQETKYYCKWCTVLLLKPKLMSPVETPHNVKSSKFDFRFSLVIRCMLSIFPYFQLPQDMGDIWSHWVRSFRAEKWGFHGCSVKKCRSLGRKCSFWPKIHFFRKWSNFLLLSWLDTQKATFLCWPPFFGSNGPNSMGS